MPCQSEIALLMRRIRRPVWAATVSAFGIGMLTYLFALTNTLFLTGDALNNVYFDGNLLWIGRWSSQWLSSLSTSYTMPYVNGLLMIVAVAALSGMLVSVFEIRSTVLAVVSSAVLMCFPTVSATLGFLHNADAYMLAAMLATLGLLMLEKIRWGLLPAVALIAVATGTYQACATFVLGMMFVRGMQLMICRPDVGAKALLLRAGRYALCLVLAVSLYYVVLLAMTGGGQDAVGDYQSVTKAASLETLAALPRNLAGCYQDFWQAVGPLSTEEGCQMGSWPNHVFIALELLMACVSFWALQGRKPLRFLAVLALCALAPFFLCAIRIFAPDKVYSLMTYSVAGTYLIGIVLMDSLPETLEKLKDRSAGRAAGRALAAASWAMLACLVVCVYSWSMDANVKFHKAKLDYENMYAQCATFLALAEANEEYVQGMPVLVIGDSSYASGRGQPAMHETKMYYTFMKYCLNVDMPFGTANEIRDQARMIEDTEDFVLMSCYPNEGCVQAIGDAMVIKLSEQIY